MDDDLRQALQLLIAKDDAGELFDREADEGGYQSRELESALAVIRATLGRA